MTQMHPPLVGTFQNSVLAEQAINDLENAGISRDEINYAGHPTKGGGFFDNLKTWFSGGEVTPERLANDLKDLGLSNDAVNYYTHQYEDGDSLVAVNSPEHEQDAFLIMRNNRASMFDGVSSSSQASTDTGNYRQRDGFSQQDMQASGAMNDYANDQSPRETRRRRGARTDTGDSIHLRGERLQAEKQQVQTGEIWVSKEVVAEEQSIDVPLSHEEIVIEHRSDGEHLSDVPVGQDERIHVTLSGEQVNVNKVPVETDEISIRKRNVEETKRFTDTVRHEEARVEQSGDVDTESIRQNLRERQ